MIRIAESTNNQITIIARRYFTNRTDSAFRRFDITTAAFTYHLAAYIEIVTAGTRVRGTDLAERVAAFGRFYFAAVTITDGFATGIEIMFTISARVAINAIAAFGGFYLTIVASASFFATEREVVLTEFTGLTIRTIPAFRRFRETLVTFANHFTP